MGILAWFPLRASSPAPENAVTPLPELHIPKSDILSPNDIAEQLEQLYAQNADLEDQLQRSNQRATGLQNDLNSLHLKLRNANIEVQNLHRRLKDSENRSKERSAHAARLDKQIKEMKDEKKGYQANMQSRIVARDHEVTFLRSKLQTATSDYAQLLEFEDQLRRKGENAQLQLEYLKCTTANPIGDDLFNGDMSMPLVAQPFVVLLIDGDAYSWSNDIFGPAYGRNPGALAALRLHNCITKYIMEHPSIPVTARIIVRIYVNEGGKYSGTDRSTHTNSMSKKLRASFRIDFNGAMPLFDYVDVGSGKERADEKIRENFHVYHSNPLCHAILLAVCTDHGFARMLEPYRYHLSAKRKICLVPAGNIASEIAALEFQTVLWPAVFAPYELPGPKSDVNARKWEVHNKKVKHVGTQDQAVKALVLDRTNAVAACWNLDAMIAKYTRSTGLRSSSKQMVVQRPPEHRIIEDPYDGSVD